MQLDIKKAIKSPFLDDKWYIKLIFPIVTMPFCMFLIYSKSYVHQMAIFIPNFVILAFLVICFIFSMMFSGFFTIFRHNAICNHSPILPELKGRVGDYFVYGFNASIINVIYVLLEKLLDLVGQIPAKGMTALILGIFLLCTYVILLIVGAFSQCSYADFFCFQSAFNFNKIFSLISKVKKEIFTYFMFFFVLILFCILLLSPFAILGRVIYLKTHINVDYMLIVIFPIIAFIILLIGLMLYSLQAQVYNIAKSRLD